MHICGTFPDEQSACAAWQAEAQRTVDDTRTRRFLGEETDAASPEKPGRRLLTRDRSDEGAAGGRDHAPCIWIHAGGPGRMRALGDIALRLRDVRPEARVVLSLPPGSAPAEADAAADFDAVDVLEADTAQAARRFLTAHDPLVCLWIGGGLLPAVIAAAAARHVTMALADIAEGDLPPQPRRWFHRGPGPALSAFHMILTPSGQTAQTLRRLGLPPERIAITPRLAPTPVPLPCDPDDFEHLADTLAGRPVWFAVDVAQTDLATLMDAHRQAVRLAHRLLLVIHHPQVDALTVQAAADASGLRHADWMPGDPIDETTQALLCTDPDDCALWYRAAPVTFLGGTLPPGRPGVSPLDAAALGSAVVYGSAAPANDTTYARLTAAGAARSLRDTAEIGPLVARLIAPDRAAEMALAGWQVVSEGAHLTDRLVRFAVDTLELDDEGP